jgi:diketogulonate reductase-like aldo/keto reductase
VNASAEPAAMSRRAIPGSPGSKELLPVIGVGTWQTFDVGDDAAVRAPLREVLATTAASGGQVIDSSPMYGRSEAVVGALIAELNAERIAEEKPAAPFFLATKVWTAGREAGIRQIEQSFARLRTRRIDLLQVHNLVDTFTHTKTLQALKAEGRIRYLGITHYSASAHAELERLLKSGAYDFLQINYSLAERQAERRLLPLAQEHRVAVLVNRPFAEGALFTRVKGRALPEWAAELGARSFAQLFLKWILGHPAVTCVIPASAKVAHAKDNLAAGCGAILEPAQRQRISDFFDRT